MRIVLTLIFWGICLGGAFGQEAIRLDYQVNSEFEEREPIISPDKQHLFFWRRETPANTGGIYDPGDIWYSHRNANGSWGKAVRLRPPLNSQGQDFVWQVSPDNDTLWLNQTPPRVNTQGIAYSTQTPDGYWRAPQKLNIRKFKYKGHYKDFFKGPGNVLLLPNESDRGYGGSDLYICFPINDTAWSQPINLGPDINTEGDEDAPFLAKDGKTLYFNSNGHRGLGGHDVFVSYRLDNSWRRWSEPVNLGPPVSTPDEDFDFYLSEDLSEAYWCSDHQSLGSNDIFFLDLTTCETEIYPKGNIRVCKGESIKMEAAYSTLPGIRYQWINDGRIIPGANERTLITQKDGSYQLIRKTRFCTDTSEVKWVQFVSPPTTEIRVDGSLMCLDDSLKLTAPIGEGFEYQWMLNNGEIPDAQNRTYWVGKPGNYSVKIFNGNCGSTSQPKKIKKFEQPGIYAAADTLTGKLPSLPYWLWTNKLPKANGTSHIRDVAVSPNGEAYVLRTRGKKGKYIDEVAAFTKEGLYRGNYPFISQVDAKNRFIAVDDDGNFVLADNSRYLTKYRMDGRMMWTKDESRKKVTGLAMDALGNVYSSGRFRDTLEMGRQKRSASARGGMFLAKHSPRGELIWLKTWHVDWDKYEMGNNVSVDCNGRVYVGGRFKLVVNFGDQVVRANMQGENLFLACFDGNGNRQWARKYVNEDPGMYNRFGDIQTDCAGNTFFLTSGNWIRLNSQGDELWRGKLRTPINSEAAIARIQAVNGDCYVSGISDKGDAFVTVLNRFNNQTLLWTGRGAAHEPRLDQPAISASPNGEVFVAGIARTSNFPGQQFDLTSGSNTFVMKYGKRKSLGSDREPVTICDEQPAHLFTDRIEGVQYQWYIDGALIAGADRRQHSAYKPGTYQVEIVSDGCNRISEPLQVIRCGDDPFNSPLVTADNRPEAPEIVVVEETPEPEIDLKLGDDGTPKRLRNRRIKSQHNMRVRSEEVTIHIWDHAAFDRDTISVNINGEWLVENYGLTKKRKVYTYRLKKGDNFIILYALNLGTQPPNTASITVDDGIRKQTIQLRSTMRDCGMLRVRVD
ncbi:hypothetical protein [Pontibacter sp. G13]|uniref:hypothetical protein n=1 Tax=Pontibacter sp. G13 TaxID=3074898 RepID=UPI00288BCEE5|nr:hypothetical protein [Pontibacter sp. G13]WNJ20316.1 hypothetical protein RJD25_07535 [Pontibacter sp. G13]